MKLNKRGFTLIELVMVMSLAAILSFTFGGFIITSMQAWLLVTGRDAAVSSSRTALNRMTAEIRRIKKAENIIIFSTSECQFLDLDSQNIDFRQSGGDLLRNSDVLAAGLTLPLGLRFTYLDATGEVAAVKQNIRSIRVWLSLNAGGQGATLESAARIRNP